MNSRVARSGFRAAAAVVTIAAVMLGGLVALAPASASSAAPVSAALSGSQFDPGNIISDQTFHDSGRMTEAQIQSFLEAKVPACAAGYTCLRDYRVTTFDRPTDPQCSAYRGAENERASTILYKVSRACGINPQVLLVLLQKEQSLVTSTTPSDSRYRAATGYGCPDTAPCDSQYMGLYSQLYRAAWQFRRYEIAKSSFNYFPVGATTQVRLHPNASCGTTPVYIRNQATANLYYYTPYTPNGAALTNLYGTGDACSSYGNRNFWRMFTDWFGSPVGTADKFGSLDRVTAVGGGVEISGWSLDPYTDLAEPSYIWVNVNGVGGPYVADTTRDWINTAYPGAGTSHGFDLFIPTAAGNRTICVYGTSSVLLGCTTVRVPDSGRAAGQIQEATPVVGGVQLTGWAVDTSSDEPIYVWVNVDGRGGPVRADSTNAAVPVAFPSLSAQHGFSTLIKASVGRHEICVFGLNSVPLGCRVVWVPESAIGSFDSATGVAGGIRVVGWSLDRLTTASTYVWANVDGRGGPLIADDPLDWIETTYPGVGRNHGFNDILRASTGSHVVCLYGTNSIALGCKSVTVPSSSQGSFDTATAVPGGIRVTGWAVDSLSSQPVYIWINVDGTGGPARADIPLNWIDSYIPGVGPNHGFDTTVPASPGSHQVCVFGYESRALGCKTVVVG